VPELPCARQVSRAAPEGRRPQTDREAQRVILTQLQPGREARVLACRAKGAGQRFLAEHGIVPGAALIVGAVTGGHLIVRLKDSRLALNIALACQVEVQCPGEVSPGEACTLRDLGPGQRGVVRQILSVGAVRRRLMDMGITRGTEVFVRREAPLGDPLEITVRGYELTLRKAEAEHILVERRG